MPASSLDGIHGGGGAPASDAITSERAGGADEGFTRRPWEGACEIGMHWTGVDWVGLYGLHWTALSLCCPLLPLYCPCTCPALALHFPAVLQCPCTALHCTAPAPLLHSVKSTEMSLRLSSLLTVPSEHSSGRRFGVTALGYLRNHEGCGLVSKRKKEGRVFILGSSDDGKWQAVVDM